MKDIIFIPCFNRPEFLKLCIEQIAKTEEAKNMKALFHIDFNYDRGILKAIESYPHDKLTIINESHRVRSKLPINILRGYKKAYMMAKEFVFMIEEDVIVGNDFFNWHYLVQKDQNLFCSIASRNNNINRNLELPNDREKYYTSHITYQSLGVCFRKEIIENLIIPHANMNYFKNLTGYCTANFPKSMLGNKWCEQAGLIRRIQESQDLKIAYPYVSRAYHAGFYGKNRQRGLNGTYMTKVEKLRNIIFNKKQMERHAQHHLYYKDSEPIPLNLEKITKVEFCN